MGYEDAVYLAKLAEQAERYEGPFENHPPYISADTGVDSSRNGGEHEDCRFCQQRTIG